MKQNSSVNSECIKNFEATNCDCRIHQCIKQIINLNSVQFNHLIDLLNLFQSPYKICDQHNYPFEFYSKQGSDIKCKFCLHTNNQSGVELIQNMTNLKMQNQFVEEPFPELTKELEKKYENLIKSASKISVDQVQQETIKKLWQQRLKYKETMEFLKLVGPREVHKEFHSAVETITMNTQFESTSCSFDVLKIRDYLLQNE